MAKWDVVSAKKGPQKYDASHTEIYTHMPVHTSAADYGKNHFLILAVKYEAQRANTFPNNDMFA